MNRYLDDTTASTNTYPNPLDFSHIKNTEFGIKIRDRNVFFFSFLEDEWRKGILLMIGERTIIDFTNVDSNNKFMRWLTKRRNENE